MDAASLVQAAAGLVLLAWLPGFAWVQALAPSVRGAARFVASVALSIALVTLALYGGNVLLSVRVSTAHAIWEALAITAAAAAIPLSRRLGDALDPET